MNLISERNFLQAQITDLNRLLTLVGANPLMAPGLEERRDRLAQRLRELPQLPNRPNAILYFSGGPVRGSQGIDTHFAAKMLENVQEMASIEFLHRKCGLHQHGRMPNSNEARLLLTALPRGSFGFELVQAEDGDLISTQQLGDALQHLVDLVRAAGESDAEFETAFSESPVRIAPKLESFFKTLKAAHAQLRLVTGDREISLNTDQVTAATERVATTRVNETEVVLGGEFRGATLDTWRFDFKTSDGATLSGRLGETLTEADVIHMAKLTGQASQARLRRYESQYRSGSLRQAWELLKSRIGKLTQ